MCVTVTNKILWNIMRVISFSYLVCEIIEQEELKFDTITTIEQAKTFFDEPETSYFDLEYLSDELKNNKELILYLVEKNGDILQYASDALKDDYDVVLEAVNCSEESLRFASDRLKNNRTICKISVEAGEVYDEVIELNYISGKLYKEYMSIGRIMDYDEINHMKYFKENIEEELIANVCHPRNYWKFEALGFFE
jgi:hypothetical protein